jgi:hypothetical protein|tara:strand:+ start:304 stop:891 length:588 start_codon:yes stop_codon:yes gene_type:complete
MKTIYFAILTLFLGQAVFAEDCSDYPQSKGINVILVEGGTKILSTAIATVPFDDVELYLDALEEAELEAKASISSVLEENISKLCSSDTASMQNIKIVAEEKSVDYEKIKTSLCSIKSVTESVLRGAVVIGHCYTPGKLVMLTVGIKPETITAAEKLSDSMENSTNSSDSTGQTSNDNNLTSVEGYSNTDKLSDF